MTTAIVVFLIAALFSLALYLLVADHFRNHNEAMCRHFNEFEGDGPRLRVVK